MSNLNIEESNLRSEDIEALLLADFEWPLERGILICLAIEPSSYNWTAYGGNDLPVRLRADCRKAIKTGDLAAYEVEGKVTVLRDDLIPFCYNITPASCEMTFEIWGSYKKRRGSQQSGRKVKSPSELEIMMDNAFKMALRKEYRLNKKRYDINPDLLEKELIYDTLQQSHSGWNRNTLRRSGAKFGIEWAIEDYKENTKKRRITKR